MKLGTIVKALGGGVLVYVGMAACAATAEVPGAGPGTSSVVTGPEGGASFVDAFVDALAHPTKSAHAAPEVTTEPCDKAAGAYNFAVHEYPGATAIELAHVRALVPNTTELKGFTHVVPGIVWVKDGAVAAACKPGDTVTFVRP